MVSQTSERAACTVSDLEESKSYEKGTELLNQFLNAHLDSHPLTNVSVANISDEPLFTQWNLQYGAHSEQCGTRENQDGWLMVLPSGHGQAYECFNHHDHSLQVSNNGVRDTLIRIMNKQNLAFSGSSQSARPIIIGVLDGHGWEGRRAATEVARGMSHWLSSVLPRMLTDATRVSTQDVAEQFLSSFRIGDLWALDASKKLKSRDCGTTATVHVLANNTLMTGWVGDSYAILVITSKCGARAGIVKLMQPHVLTDPNELNRINHFKTQENVGGGRVVIGQGGVERLIPKNWSYDQARMHGLSINMSRAIGHTTLRHCALSPTPDLTVINLDVVIQHLINRRKRSHPDGQSNRRRLLSSMCIAKKYHAADYICNEWCVMEVDRLEQSIDPELASRSLKLYLRAKESMDTVSTEDTLQNDSASCFPSPTSPILSSTPIQGASSQVTTPKLANQEETPDDFVYHLVSYTDGVSDVISPTEIAEMVLDCGNPADIARRITRKAELTRQMNKYRADNCTVSVLRFSRMADN